MTLVAGSLFTGIGGFELGLERAGLITTAWQVEISSFCRRVLIKHWPSATRYRDVRKVGRANLSSVDLICGGFPCQDVSSAGNRIGLDGERSGLWREFRRIVEELRPSWVVVENVASGKGRWLPFVRRDLHVLGYRTRAFALSAKDVGAPHRRRRVFVVAADPDRVNLRQLEQWQPGRREDKLRDEGQALLAWDGEARASADTTRNADVLRHEARGEVDGPSRSCRGGDASDSARERCETRGRPRRSSLSRTRTQSSAVSSRGRRGRSSQSGVRGVDDGLSTRLDAARIWAVEAPPGSLDRSVPETRLEKSLRLKRNAALGNAIVSQCAMVIGRIILDELRGAE